METNKIKHAIFAFMSLCLMSASAHAIPVTIDVVSGNWTNVQGGGSTLSFSDTDGLAGNEAISWGTPATANGPSGYVFQGAAPMSFTVNTGTIFGLGSLTHNNFPVFPPSISGATLEITTMLSIAGVAITEGPFSFSLFHDETPNNCNSSPTCADDIVTFANNPGNTDTFNVNGTDYTFNLSSFLFNGTTATSFSSPEGAANTALLLASIDEVPPVSVPEPTSMLLLGIGLTAIGATSRRRRNKK